ncbi:MAG: hypothetical protein ABI220_00140 [Candidatus Saccharimonadales bacterium]
MKKLFYLIPFALLILNFLPVSVYKDTVKLVTLSSATPSHWRIAKFDLSAGSTSLVPTDAVSPAQAEKIANASMYISNGATFRGFPFGAYFSKSSAQGTSSASASAYSILWILSDILLIAIAVLTVFYFDRRKQSGGVSSGVSQVTPPVIAALSQAVTPQPVVSPSTITPEVSSPASPIISPVLMPNPPSSAPPEQPVQPIQSVADSVPVSPPEQLDQPTQAQPVITPRAPSPEIAQALAQPLQTPNQADPSNPPTNNLPQ